MKRLNLNKNLLRNDKGQALAEYCLVLGLIAIITTTIVSSINPALADYYDAACQYINSLGNSGL